VAVSPNPFTTRPFLPFLPFLLLTIFDNQSFKPKNAMVNFLSIKLKKKGIFRPSPILKKMQSYFIKKIIKKNICFLKNYFLYLFYNRTNFGIEIVFKNCDLLQNFSNLKTNRLLNPGGFLFLYPIIHFII
jgi:hypothetical protein